jgi:hypothetical protein
MPKNRSTRCGKDAVEKPYIKAAYALGGHPKTGQ